jgi:NAD(P)-dependent dehydrogenase (short-subunit alcohol dehydrogenase family)
VRFEGKWAIVTGANSGIGRATAMQLLDEGCEVLAVDRRNDEPWAESVSSRVRAVTVDLAAPDAAESVIAALDEASAPRVDVLVNAAGILRIAPFLDVTRAAWDDVLTVNLKAVFFLTQAVGRRMIRENVKGRIVNVSSVHATVSEPNAAPYTASKGGLEAMTRTIASELAEHGITVNCVRPGATWTQMSAPIYTDAIIAALADRVPLREIAQPAWISAAICYLASDEARYTTGACLDVDGGYAMNGALGKLGYE